MATITNFKDELLLYGGNEVDDIASDTNAFLNWVNQALVNRHEEVCVLSNKWTTSSLTFSTKGYELAQPTDWDRISEIILYKDSDHQYEYDYVRPEFGILRFALEQAASTTYYLRYRQQATTYTAMGDTFTEIANPRMKKIMMDEVIGLFLQSEEDLEMSSAMSNVFNNADQNS